MPSLLLNPEYREELARIREEGLGWTIDGLANWTTASIVEHLRGLGIDTDIVRFRQQAIAAGDLGPLDQAWMREMTPDYQESQWIDFPVFAIAELWERLTPDLICMGLIRQRLHDAFEADGNGSPLAKVNGLPATLVAMQQLAAYLRTFPLPERPAKFEALAADGCIANHRGEIKASFSEWTEGDYLAEAKDVLSALSECGPKADLQHSS